MFTTNAAHLHLVLNHIPIVATYGSLLVLITGYILKNQTVRQTGLVLLVAASVFAIPAYLTGDPAEDILEAAGQANHNFIEEHEELAEGVVWFCVTTGLLSLIAFVTSLRKMNIAKPLTLIVTVASLGCSIALYKVGETGGEIRHTEIRDGQTKMGTHEESENDH